MRQPDNGARHWTSLPDAPAFQGARQQATEILASVTGLVADPGRFRRVSETAEQAWARAGSSQRWDVPSIDFGPLAAALFAAHVDAADPNHGWAALSSHYLARTPRWDGGQHLSLFMSPLALAFVLSTRNEYARLHGRPTPHKPDWLISYIETRLPALLRRDDTFSYHHYDLIAGMTGACLLLHALAQQGDHGASALHRVATSGLAALSEDNPGSPTSVPPFWVRRENLPSELHRAIFAQGCADLGAAHGIAGPLLALSLMDESQNSARDLARYLEDRAKRGATFMWWPSAVGPMEDTSNGDRFAWCYGTPGISRLLFLASIQLGDWSTRRLAVAAARGVARRILAGTSLPDPGLCHGNAGLLQIMLRFANDLGDELFWRAAVQLIAALHAAFDSSLLCGFVATTRNGSVSSPCLLNGSLGIGLSLMSAVEDVEPAWDRLLGLSVAGATQA